MALLGDDGRGYDLARKLETLGVWQAWLGDSSYFTFFPFLSSSSTWEAFMRSDESKSRAQIQLQLRARALLFDKASVSLFLRSNPSSSGSLVSKINPSYLQLHGDDVFFTLENHSQDGVQQREAGVLSNTMTSTKILSKSAIATGSRYKEIESDNATHRFRAEELPESWYNQFIEKYRVNKSHKRESDKRTTEDMSAYLKSLEKHKRRCILFREDPHVNSTNLILENQSNVNSDSVVDIGSSADDDTPFFPEIMYPMNCVPENVLPPARNVQENRKLELNGVFDTLPQILTRHSVMIDKLGVKPEYLSMDQGLSLYRASNGTDGSRKTFGQEQSMQISQKVIARMLNNAGFEGATEVPMEVFSQLMSCHICKLGSRLKLLADSYKKQCSAIELLKMFLKTMRISFVSLVEHVKDGSRNFVQQPQQLAHGIQSQILSPRQNPLQIPQQILRQMHPQMQQQVQPPNLAYQQQQLQQQQQQQQLQLDRMRRRQPSTPRPSMEVNKEKALGQVKTESQSDFPVDGGSYALNARNPQFQVRQQQQMAAMSGLHPQSNSQFRQMAALQMPQIQHQQNASVVRAPPVKVEGFQELMGGDSSVGKHDSEEARPSQTSNNEVLLRPSSTNHCSKSNSRKQYFDSKRESQHRAPRKVMSELKTKAQQLKNTRDYSFLPSDEAQLPVSTKEHPPRSVSVPHTVRR